MSDTAPADRKRFDPSARKYRCEFPGCGKKFGLLEYLQMHQADFGHDDEGIGLRRDAEKHSEDERSFVALQWSPEEQVFYDPYVQAAKKLEHPPPEKTNRRRVEIIHSEDSNNSNIDLGDESQENTCRDCGKTFSSKYNLDRHIQLHRGVRYPCTICGKVYSQKYAWGQHMKMTHKEWRKDLEGTGEVSVLLGVLPIAGGDRGPHEADALHRV